MEETNTNTKAASASAETEKEGYGKFKDAKSVLEAYDSLQAEFTKRCQRVKELEGKLSEAEKAIGQPSTEKKVLSEDEKNAVIREYVAEILKNRAEPVMTVGSTVYSPRRTAKTVAEAGAMAKELIKTMKENK